jgi:phosphoglycerol transferase MdoB-like AlkP superfamily enzyme
VAAALLIGAALLLLGPSARLAAIIVVDALLSAVILGDVVHVRFYGDVFSLLTLSQAGMAADVRASIFPLFEWTDAFYFADVAALLVAAPLLILAYRRKPSPRMAARSLAAALALVGLIAGIPSGWIVARDENGLLALTTLQREVCSVTGLLPYHLLDAVLHHGGKRVAVETADLERVHQMIEAERAARRDRSPLFGVARGRNVILVSAESLMAFPIGLSVRGQPVTPNLTALASESLTFTHFHDQTHLGTTADAEFLALQSLYPLGVGVVASQYPGDHFDALPAILGRHGYSTVSACGAPPTFWAMDTMHRAYGFRHSFFDEAFVGEDRLGEWVEDRAFFRRTVSLLRSEPEPFLAFLLSSSNHAPFLTSPEQRRLDLGPLEGTVLGNYLHSVRRFDDDLGALIAELRTSGLLDRTVLAVYGDHQAFVGEPQELARLIGFDLGDELARFRVRKRIPFLVRLPGGASAAEHGAWGGELDIAPTLLSLLGIEEPNAVMMGRDLTRGEDTLVVFRDGSFTDGQVFFLNRFGATSRSRCYEVSSGKSTDCTALEGLRRKALERLAVSDLIVRGDLFPGLRAP